MAGGEIAAVFKQLATDAARAMKNIAKSMSGFTAKTAEKEEGNLARTMGTEAHNAEDLTRIHPDGKAPKPHLENGLKSPEGTGAPKATGEGHRAPHEPEAGQPSQGNENTPTTKDPVDVVSGQLLVSTLDVALPGILPLVLRRAYASGYRTGGLFGPGWSSTLDIRLLIDDERVRFFGDNAQTLTYPSPSPLPVPEYPEHGARWPLERDRSSGGYQVTNPDSGLTWSFPNVPDADAATRSTSISPLATIRDRNNNGITLLRDETGTLTEIAHSGGYRVAVDTHATDNGIRVTGLRLQDGTNDGAGVVLLAFAYDRSGRLSGITDSSGVAYQYEWDDQNRITAWIDRAGYRYCYEYDAQGRVVHSYGEGGFLSTSLAYDPQRGVTVVTDSLGHPTEYHYDRFQQITKIVDPLGGTVLTERDRYGRLLARSDELGNTTLIQRDRDGNPVRIDYPDGSAVTADYRAPGQPNQVTCPDDTVWQYTYDQRGNVLTVTNPAGDTTSYSYANTGGLTSSVDALGQQRTFETDQAGLPITATDAMGNITSATRNAFGRIVALADPLGAVTRLSWNVEGRMVRQQAPDGAAEEWAYDPLGNMVAHTDAVSGMTRIDYGPFRTVLRRIEPDGTRYSYTHDTELRLTQVTGPTGLTWDYEYDAAGRLSSECDFNGRVLTYQHDAAGGLIGKTTGAGQTVEYLRDAFGLVVERHVGEDRFRYGYDRMSRLVRAEHGDSILEYSRDSLGRIVAETSNGRRLTRDYDALGRAMRRMTPSGAVSDWVFDASGLPISLVTAGGELTFRHDAAGRETDRGLGPHASMSQSFDAVGRLTTQEVWSLPGQGARPATEPVELERRTYRYRADGLAEQFADRLRGDREITLDAAGHVTSVQAATWTENYAYDALGNLINAQNSGAPNISADVLGAREVSGTRIRRAGRTSYQHDAQGRLVRQTRRTLSGQRRTWTYTWDGDDQLVAVALPDGTRWIYGYDPLGRRVAKQRYTPAGAIDDEVLFTWDGPQLAEQTSIAPDGQNTTLTWDWKPNTWQVAAQTQHTGSVDTHADAVSDTDTAFWAIVTDLTGGPTELINHEGHVVWQHTTDLWGAALGSLAEPGVDCPLRQPGQCHDPETGLYYNYFRYYDPHTARYLSADPLGLLPGPNDYAYVANPYVTCDPLGLASLRGPLGRWMSDPNRPRGYDRDSQYPHDYSQRTHDEMVRRWTDEGRAIDGGGVPRDANGVRIPRDQLTWRDEAGNKIPYTAHDPLTYDHAPMSVVQHWNAEGYNTDYATRKAWYDNPDHLTPMLRSENSRKGALAEDTWDMKPGENHRCRGG